MIAAPSRYFMLNKVHGMTSQFISTHPTTLLGDVAFDFPEGIHAVGRLDKNSEGLLLLTTNKKITALLFQSKVPHKRTYLVQVKNKINAENLQRLRTGISIRIKGGERYTTPPCDVQLVSRPDHLWKLPFQKYVYDESSWLLITLTEGRFHQVRKMVFSVSHRCQRLIRVSIEDMLLLDLPPGGVKEFAEEEFFTLLHLDKSSIKNAEEKIKIDPVPAFR
ncbi:MAG: pseudouridine synthase [Flavitalea sp.]